MDDIKNRINVHICLSLSNWIFGIIPLIQSIIKNDKVATIFIMSAILASTFMHISDSKGGRKSLLFEKYSKIFLNIDRFVAWSSVIWGLYRIYNYNIKLTMIQWYILTVGFIFNGLSELLVNSISHTITHGIWHACAYYGLYYMIV